MITELGSSKLYLGNDGDVIRGQGLHDPGLLCPHAFAVEDVVDALHRFVSGITKAIALCPARYPRVVNKAMELWNSDAFYIPGLHTKPLCDKEPDIAPSLNPLRESLQELAGRPVNFQATSSLVLYSRDILFGEPYYVVVHPEEGA